LATVQMTNMNCGESPDRCFNPHVDTTPLSPF
jgi:hypothetical protein